VSAAQSVTSATNATNVTAVDNMLETADRCEQTLTSNWNLFRSRRGWGWARQT
jgi:hypothetical protein